MARELIGDVVIFDRGEFVRVGSVDAAAQLGVRLLEPPQLQQSDHAHHESGPATASSASSGTPMRCSRFRTRQAERRRRFGRERQTAVGDLAEHDSSGALACTSRAGCAHTVVRVLHEKCLERVGERCVLANSLAHRATAPVHVVRGGHDAVFASSSEAARSSPSRRTRRSTRTDGAKSRAAFVGELRRGTSFGDASMSPTNTR